jgi:hypothetical protein
LRLRKVGRAAFQKSINQRVDGKMNLNLLEKVATFEDYLK